MFIIECVHRACGGFEVSHDLRFGGRNVSELLEAMDSYHNISLSDILIDDEYVKVKTKELLVNGEWLRVGNKVDVGEKNKECLFDVEYLYRFC